MLNREEIFRIAKFTGLRPYQQEKNYIHTLILKSIYNNYNLIFKGGTALMMAYGLNRFSEDLDFTFVEPFDQKKLIEKVFRDLSLMGIAAQIGKSKAFEMGFSFRIGVQGPLYRKEIDRCYVYVEISFREKVLLIPEIHASKPIYSDLLPFSYSVMQKEEILAEKFRALCTRKKARDLYDTWFLLDQGVHTNLDMINRKLKFYNIQFSDKNFENRLDLFSSLWNVELQPFIFGEIPSFNRIIQKLKEYVSQIQKE